MRIEQKEIAPNPVQDEVIASLVSDTISDLCSKFERSDRSSWNVSIAYEALTLLSGFRESISKTTFAQMHKVLSPQAEEKKELPWNLGNRYRQFVDDLEILSIFEREGIKGINQRLDQTLQQLQEGKLDHDQQRELVSQANHFLYRAIYLFPHLVSSVEVQVDENAADKSSTKKLRNEYYDTRRYDYEKLHEELIKRGSHDPNTLVIPLPYGFTTGTHGSGERAAMSESRREIYFDFQTKRDNPRVIDPGLFVTIEHPLIVNKEVMFLPKEVRSIRLSQRVDYTPFFIDSDRKGPLISRGNHIEYYLGFRDFSNYGSGLHIKGEQRRTIHEPSKSTWNLWKTTKEYLLERGFFVVYSDNPDETVMYEVNDYKLRGYRDKTVTGAMVQDVINRDERGKLDEKAFSLIRSRRASFKKYTGDQIIERLAQIHVQPRRF